MKREKKLNKQKTRKTPKKNLVEEDLNLICNIYHKSCIPLFSLYGGLQSNSPFPFVYPSLFLIILDSKSFITKKIHCCFKKKYTVFYSVKIFKNLIFIFYNSKKLCWQTIKRVYSLRNINATYVCTWDVRSTVRIYVGSEASLCLTFHRVLLTPKGKR